ncbi:TPA: PTS transporter subunit IIC [Enterococcus faecium]|uniref:PTS galactitol transporter subunit IIC n=1 Tax=Enterococcus faecium TaxID=1352 RepID=UPI0012440B98|nr:PTS transporter subunit IIC [Enterococcus faecium]QEX00121.1 PTS maltose transporter subunit IIABC [Enterococcus faecium]HAP6207666.1 PTS maltose transporter subunit IIABC [Enterococcus faecium]HAX1488522.1 PTS maltose transporter subunit IIABC [Enterococcus faecium]HAZ9079818.1 PTS maltose transporter subunit IIABC [Enterococcus faecium]HAZ9106557.1 PTS maltose transporter subunit IIABC [Enterococcus faecium]
MNIVIDALNWISSLGPMIMMPIIILILGLFFRIKLNTLLKSALTVGIGFAGVNIIINWFISQVGPSVQLMVKNWGIQTSIMDVGWPARAAATWSFPLAAVMVFIILGINVLMLIFKKTNTVMVDFWSYNHYIFVAALVYYATDKNIILAVIFGAIDAIISFKLADWTTPLVEDYFELEGVNFPTANSVGWAPLAWLLNKLWDRIPGLNKVDARPEKIQERFGFVGEPMFMGFVIGLVIGLLAKEPVDKVLILGMSTSATMVLTPKMMQILMEGLLPFANSVKKFLNVKFPGNNFTMGVDAALTVANSSAIATGIIMVPITLVLAAILPGNKLLPISDIAYQAMWLSAWPVAFSKGNIIRGILSTTIITACVLLIATSLAGIHTQLALAGGFQLPAGMTQISTEDAGTHIIGFILMKIAEFISNIF